MSDWLKSNRDILLVVLVAFGLRASLVGLVHAGGYTGDEKEYISLATKLAEGKPFVDSNGEWSTKAPLFAFAMSLVFRVFGGGLLIPHLLNCLLGAIAVYSSFALSLKLFEQRFVALIAASFGALYPSFIIYSDILQTEALYVVFVLGAFLFVERMQTNDSFAEAAMLGLMSALAALTRAVFFGFFPLLLVVVAWMNRARLKAVLPKLIVAAAVWCAMLAPWTLRNYNIHGTFVPISSWGGISFLLGNNPYSNGTWSGKPGYREWFAKKANENGVDLQRSTEIERSALGKKLALDFVSSQPGEALKLAAKKFYMHWVYPITNSDENEKLQALCVAADIIIYTLCGIGLIAVGVKRSLLPIGAAIMFFTALQVILHCESRYRLPIMPFVIMLAAVGASVLIDTRKLREFFDIRRKKILASSWVVAVGVVYAYTAWQFLTGNI